MKRILLAEDDADDKEIFTEIISDIGDDIGLSIVENGEHLIEYLDALEESEFPDLIVLDQNMPRLKGNEALQILRANKRYQSIPAVIYSTYHDSKFVADCAAMNIELLLKPDTYDGFKILLKDLLARYM